MRTSTFRLSIALGMMVTLSAFSEDSAVAEHIATLKKSFATSQLVLREYEWVESTVISLKGDEKSRKMERCYYGDDGKVQKEALNESEPEGKKRRLGGRVIEKVKEKKKEELTEYMQEAIALLRKYIPPDHTRIQEAKEDGKVALEAIESGKRIRVNIADFLKKGMTLSPSIWI